MSEETSSSGFVTPADYSEEWRDITLVHRRTHTLIYTAARYGRRFLLKALPPQERSLTDYRLQQDREFRLGIQLVHPNIAATYGLEEVDGLGRCIVQEWIDGVTLGEWLQTKPSRAERESVFGQLIEALDYVHGLQLVHHDLKTDNILITRNGTNVKLIDFGLSATDATLSPVPNDIRTDIQALGRLVTLLFPRKKLLAQRCQTDGFAKMADLRRALMRRKRLTRLLPVVLSIVLLAIAVLTFYLAARERQREQAQYEAMLKQIDYYIATEREQILALIYEQDSCDLQNAEDRETYMAYLDRHTAIRQRQWQVRDSLMAGFPANSPLKEQFYQIWTRKELDLDDELYPQILGKGKP